MNTETPPPPLSNAEAVQILTDGRLLASLTPRQIGCDGEENAPPNTRKLMALVAHAIAAAFLVGGDAGAAERAERLAEYIMQKEERHA